MHKIRMHKNGAVAEIEAEHGENLHKVLRESGVDLASPCGGNGTCGKCRVMVKGLNRAPSQKELRLLGEKSLKKGFRLACHNSVDSDLEVFIQDTREEATIMTAGKVRKTMLQPVVSKEYAELEIPALEDQVSDLERILNSSKLTGFNNSIDFVRGIPGILRKEAYKATFVYINGELAGVEPGNTSDRLYGIAVDIGTTTVAAYLYNLIDGRKLDTYSMLNPQRKFGADVLSRIEYTMGSEEALNEMNRVIIDCMNGISDYFSRTQSISKEDIYAFVFAGNTTMMHFLMNVTAAGIAVSPFIPATTKLHRFRASEMRLDINPYGCVVILPGVSGYIGADTVAAVLSSGMYSRKSISLLVDIGTNGEIVLGNKDWLYSCSTAAGPAFEGANIRNGVGGIKGAIDKVSFENGFSYTTIGNEKPVGICGSGVIDMVAGMLSAGIIDETGRIPEADEVELPEQLTSMLCKIDGHNSVMIIPSEKANSQNDIAITQKDVRELQNAKAAIAAGIRTLAVRAGIRLEEIEKVYLAGGFGSYINIDSALKIALIPSELKGKIESIGNAAGAGAIEGLLSIKRLREAEKLKKRIKYIELSASPDFVDSYIESMLFE